MLQISLDFSTNQDKITTFRSSYVKKGNWMAFVMHGTRKLLYRLSLIGCIVLLIGFALYVWYRSLSHELDEPIPGGIVVCEEMYPFIWQDYVKNESGEYLAVTRLPELQNGDVLTTDSTHFLGWRHGHAALVVDAEHHIVIEAFCVGTVSELSYTYGWQYFPGVQVLRLKADRETRNQIAKYAKEHLQGIPYRLSAGVIDDKDMKGDYWGTQCAHLVWLAFYYYGYDVDGNGGWLVTPADLQKSELFEVVPLIQ